MSQLFISHSSRDNFAAQALVNWLGQEGFSDIFFDLDPERGILAGERWERALNQAAFRCEAVIFLVSKNWLASEWCRKEHALARGKNKALFAALIDETLAIADLPPTLTGTWQVADLAHGVPTQTLRTRLPGSDEEQHVDFAEVGLVRLRNGLQRAGLDPKYFDWPPANEPNRAPYPGFAALEAEDAGVFFGREAPLVEAMDKLRGHASGAPPRLHVLLGASGAGKSSFLRAGLLPRLARDDRYFLPLSPIRPERDPVLGDSGLLGALSKAFPKVARASLRAAIEGGAQRLRALLGQIVSEAQSRIAVADEAARAPALVIAVDQAEELFSLENAAEGARLLELLAALVSTDDPATIVLFAIRSDGYDRLQRAKPIADLSQQAQSLPPLPRGEYARVIEGPAARVAAAGRMLKIDPRLTLALLDDLEQGDASNTSDALPLLAFTLEHLWREFGAAGELKREHYFATGRVGGVIDRAVTKALQAADADFRIPRDAAIREKLLRRGFIPWLAGIDPETRTPRRAIARRHEIPEAVRPLMDLLVSQRLLRVDAREEIGSDGTGHRVATLEPAHEALLRQWDRLKRWLEEDFALLVTLEGLKRAARDWEGNYRDAAWAVHSGARLKDALGLDERPDFAATATSQVRDYLVACRTKENAADRLQRDAEVRSALLAARASQSLTEEGSVDAALSLLLESVGLFTDESVPDYIRIAFTKALQKKAHVEEATSIPNSCAFEVDNALLIYDPVKKDIWTLSNSITPNRIVAGTHEDDHVLAAYQSVNTDDVLVIRETLAVERINLTTGERHKVNQFPEPKQHPGIIYDKERNNWIPPVEYLGYDLIGRRSFSKTSSHDLGYNYQIMDGVSGQMVEGQIPFDAVIGGKSLKDLFLYDRRTARTFVLIEESGTFTLRDAKIPREQDGLWRCIPCLRELNDQQRLFIWEHIRRNAEHPYSKVRCRNAGSVIIVSVAVLGSSGEWHDDRIFFFGIEGYPRCTSVQDELILFNATRSNFTWIGVAPPNPAATWSSPAIGVIVKRDAVVKVLGSTILHFRHPNQPTHGRFISDDCLVVMEAETGRLWAHDLADVPRKPNSLFARPSNAIIGSDAPQTTLHHGTCVGRAIPLPEFFIMPDGRRLYCDTSSLTRGGQKNELRISDESVMFQIPLSEGTRFITISDRWERLIVSRGKASIGDSYTGKRIDCSANSS